MLRCFGLNKGIQLFVLFAYPFRFVRNAVPTRPDNRGSTVLHLNIRSIAKNKNILEECLHELNCCPDILTVSETKLNKNNVNLASIENYSIVYSNSSSNAEGVAIYILNNSLGEKI